MKDSAVCRFVFVASLCASLFGWYRGLSQPVERIVIIGARDSLYDRDHLNALRKFDVRKKDIPGIDSLIMRYIADNRNQYSWAEQIADLDSYFRQYLGIQTIRGTESYM